ncbi:MAG: AAA family ATPase [Deltaproteobacteria bacterium]|nr:AAA family ATPase [Deltaproteobacteria bacterium]
MPSAKTVARPRESGRLEWFQVKGFKSHRGGSRVDFRALTVLAGANSSGKSSVMQPLLMLKQTLHEDRYDPGPLKLDGPNVEFSETSQFFTRDPRKLSIRLTLGLKHSDVILTYGREGPGVQLKSTKVRDHDGGEIELSEGKALSVDEVSACRGPRSVLTSPLTRIEHNVRWRGARHGIAHRIEFSLEENDSWYDFYDFTTSPSVHAISGEMLRMIHLSGHRGNPSRRYPRTFNTSEARPGLFHEQVAALIAHWKKSDHRSFEQLQKAIQTVGLGSMIEPVDIDATSIDLHISRTRSSSEGAPADLVSIADVGFGVSQSLPVLVALIDAKPGQLVYIEQPEIHLHPRAQVGVADLIVEASRRGARVVIETHSEIILTRIQYHVAKGTLPPKDVLVHWFACDPKTGDTTVTAVEPDAAGAFGDWPVDFAEVGERVDREYIEAAWKRQSGEAG